MAYKLVMEKSTRGDKSMKAGWVLPSFIEGSGGHRTMFQNIQCLLDHGYECHVFIEDNGEAKSSAELEKMVEKYFGGCPCHYHLGLQITGEFDILFATAWFTAKVVRDYPHAKHKAYFIQDFEALFNPMGDGYLLACASYCYGLSPITIGKWLTNKMQTEYHLHSQYFDFCADHKVYYRDLSIKKENAICFIYQPEKPRRCSAIGIEALGIVKYLKPEIKIYLYGSSEKGHIWFEHTNLGIIPIHKCNELYNRCTVGLCISSSNPSRIPFEMMASGLPVVDLYMENNLYDMPDEGVLLAHYTPESIAQALLDIIENSDKARDLSEYGIQYMKNRTLEYGYDQFFHAVDNLVHDRIRENSDVEKIYRKGPVIADVILQNTIQMNTEYQSISVSQDTLIERLKKNRLLRRSKLARKVWNVIKRY